MTTVLDISALPPLEQLIYWINERWKIKEARRLQLKWPWTDDPILRTYRFCNVMREDDKVTRWIKREWRDRHDLDPNLWHAMLVARYINWPDTLRVVRYPEPWPESRGRVRRALLDRDAEGSKVFTGAYIVSTNGAPMGKIAFIIDLFDLAWRAKRPSRKGTLAQAHATLMEIKGVGSFMGAQIIADLKHTPYLRNAPDWWDWAAPGPGSKRGLSKILGESTQKNWKQEEFIYQLKILRGLINHRLPVQLCLQDFQNCLCEFDKYTRVLNGKGKPRSRYEPPAWSRQ